MLEESKYIESVWNRYHEYCKGNYKNDFYETRVYREEKDYSKLLKIAAMIILCITTSLGGVYAGVAIYSNYIKNAIYAEINEQMISKKWVKENMNLANDGVPIYYKDITTYSEYQKYKEKFKLEEYSETDFENNFIVLIVSEQINIENVATDEETMTIEFKREYNTKPDVQTLLLSKEQYRENIKLARIHEDTHYTNIAIQDIPKDYTKEQAIADGCVVVENDKVISNNENLIYEFVEKSKNGENGFIRIVKYYTNREQGEYPTIDIREVECKDKTNLYSYRTIFENHEQKKYQEKFDYAKLKEELNNKYFVIINNLDEIEIIKF